MKGDKFVFLRGVALLWLVWLFLFLKFSKVFPWRPKMVKGLTGAGNLLSGILISEIPASCATHDLETFKAALSQFSGIQKVKVQAHSLVMNMKLFIQNVTMYAGSLSSLRHCEVKHSDFSR
jgi:hypothetical protein